MVGRKKDKNGEFFVNIDCLFRKIMESKKGFFHHLKILCDKSIYAKGLENVSMRDITNDMVGMPDGLVQLKNVLNGKVDDDNKRIYINDKMIRYISEENEVWFVGKDIAELLEYYDTKQAIENLVYEEDKKSAIAIWGGKKDAPKCKSMHIQENTILINEFGLNTLLMKSKKKDAIKFQRWICKVVIPSIRKTGQYNIKDSEEENIPEMLEYLNIMNSTSIFYILRIAAYTYKFGITDNYAKRKEVHNKTFPNNKEILIRDVNNFSIAKKIEDEFKKWIKVKKIHRYFCEEDKILYDKNLKKKKNANRNIYYK